MKKATRIKTYHGIPVPPWKHDVVKKSMTLVFIIIGRIPSKKNELVAVVDRVDAFKHLNKVMGHLNTLKSKMVTKEFAAKMAVTMLFKTFGRVKNAMAYEKWESDTVDVFKAQLEAWKPAAAKHGILFPITRATVSTKFYWKGKHKRDNSNKSEGLHDALVKAQILLDDSDRVIPDTSQSARDYSEEITQSMAVIYITVPVK